jgi:hypothetical protein
MHAFLPANRRSATHMHVFVATDCTPEALRADEMEDIVNIWFVTAKIDALIVAGAIENGMLLAGWALFESKHDA